MSDGGLGRVEAVLAQLDKRLGEAVAGLHQRLDSLDTPLMAIEGRLTVLEQRLDHKASNALVSLWGVMVSGLLAAGVALVKLWPEGSQEVGGSRDGAPSGRRGGRIPRLKRVR